MSETGSESTGRGRSAEERLPLQPKRRSTEAPVKAQAPAKEGTTKDKRPRGTPRGRQEPSEQE